MILGFAGVTLPGAVALMLPIATARRIWTLFHEALPISAVCVTGLVARDTGSYWSVFGQTAMLLLIQIGRLRVITGASLFADGLRGSADGRAGAGIPLSGGHAAAGCNTVDLTEMSGTLRAIAILLL